MIIAINILVLEIESKSIDYLEIHEHVVSFECVSILHVMNDWMIVCLCFACFRMCVIFCMNILHDLNDGVFVFACFRMIASPCFYITAYQYDK